MFSKESIDSLRQAIKQGKVSQGPVDLQILPTTRCNAACIFCPPRLVSKAGKEKFAPRWLQPETDMNFGILDRLMDDLYRMGGLKRIHITGGEPLLYKRLMVTIFLLRRTFPAAEIALVTNGLLLEKFAVALAASGLDRISISVNAGSECGFEKQSGTPGSNLEKIRAGLKLLRKARDKKAAKPYLSLTLVLNRHNYREVEAALDFGVSAGADAVSYIPLMEFSFPGEPARELSLAGKEFADFLKEIESLQPRAKKKGIYLGFTGRPEGRGRLETGDIYKNTLCYSGYNFAMIWPDGSVRPCCNCEMDLGNLHEQSFYRIWNGKRAREIRERMLREAGRMESCDCAECGYLYENQEFHRRLEDHE